MVSLDFPEFREFKATKEKKVRLDHRAIKATRVSVVIKEIRAKLVHLAIKAKEVTKAKKECLAVLGA
jgi:hypothetical protein